MLLWTLGCRYLLKLMFLFSSDIYPEVELLDLMVVAFLVYCGSSILFSIRDYTNLYSYQQYMRVPFFLHPLQLLLLADFLMIPILTDVRWHFIVVFICISLIVSNVEHLFMCLFVIYITSLEKSLLFILLSWIVCFFDTELKELFIYFGILTLYQLYHLQILSSI